MRERERGREGGYISRMDEKVKEGVYDHQWCYGGCELGLDPGRRTVKRSIIDRLPWDTVNSKKSSEA